MLVQNKEVLQELREDPCLVQDLQDHHSGYQNLSGLTSIKDFYLMFFSLLKQTSKYGEAIQPSQCWIL